MGETRKPTSTMCAGLQVNLENAGFLGAVGEGGTTKQAWHLNIIFTHPKVMQRKKSFPICCKTKKEVAEILGSIEDFYILDVPVKQDMHER